MKISFARPFLTSAILALAGSLSLLGQTADQQLMGMAVQQRSPEGIDLKLVLTNSGSKSMKLVAGHLQTTFPGRGGQLSVILQQPAQVKDLGKDDIVSLLPGESREIRLLIKKEQLPKEDTLIANVTYRISEEFGHEFGVWHGVTSLNPTTASESR